MEAEKKQDLWLINWKPKRTDGVVLVQVQYPESRGTSAVSC